MEQQFYEQIKRILSEARHKVYQTANFAMVEAYWNIGKSIVEQQDGYEKAEYGSRLIAELSKRMTVDFGKGFTPTNLKYMRQFYLTFPNSHALRDELSWTHYRLLMRVENEYAREFYTEEAIKSNWSTRQLEREINSFFYERLLSSQNKEKISEEIQKLEPAKVPEVSLWMRLRWQMIIIHIFWILKQEKVCSLQMNGLLVWIMRDWMMKLKKTRSAI